MNWIKEINEYIPYNDQESKEQQVMIEYINQFDNLLTRENNFAHMTASAFAVNKKRDKVLMVHHNIYDAWAWTGGHADGLNDMAVVALKELKEETGVKNAKFIFDNAISLDIIPVFGHFKNGEYVASHLHLNLTYVFECDEEDALFIKEDENSDVRWLPLNKLNEYSDEKHILTIYNKIIDRLQSNT